MGQCDRRVGIGAFGARITRFDETLDVLADLEHAAAHDIGILAGTLAFKELIGIIITERTTNQDTC